jgi:hypothetical protein
MEIWRNGDMETGHGDIETWRHQMENGKQKTEVQ